MRLPGKSSDDPTAVTYIKVDDGFGSHPKVVELGTGARGRAVIGLWMLAALWCGKHLTDGLLPQSVALSMAKQHEIDLLIKVGLWEKVPEGYRFHDWTDYQTPRESVLVRRESARLRVARNREKRRDV